jgi:electron transport complex protein RnfG
MTMFKKILPALILGAICLVCVLLLATTNELTKDAILEQEVAAALERKQALFPEGDQFVEIELTDEMRKAMISGGFAADEIHEALDASGNLLGYVVITRSFGYAGDVIVTSGFAADGSVVRVFATAENDTPKLGKEVEKEPFLSQFTSVEAGEHAIISGGSGGSVLAVSGATISSKAAGDAFNAAVDAIIYLQEEGVIGS